MQAETEKIGISERDLRWSTFNKNYALDHTRGNTDPVNANVIRLLQHYVSHDATVLDFGCNVGELAEVVGSTFSLNVEGCDINPAAVEIAAKHYPEITFFVEGDPAKVQKQYGIVLLIEVLEHIPDRVTFLKALREHALIEGGLLVVVVPNHWALFSRLAAFVSGKRFAYDPTHTIEFNPVSFRKLVIEAGFSVEVIQTKPLAVPGLQYVSKTLKESMPSWLFGRHIYAVLRV